MQEKTIVKGFEKSMNTVENLSPKALVLEPREIYDSCIVGMTNSGKAIYDTEKVIEAGISIFGSYEDSLEWHDYNTFSTYMGEMTPIFRH